MKTTWKRYRVLLTAAGMAVCMAAGMMMGIGWSRGHIEDMAVRAADEEMAEGQTDKDGTFASDYANMRYQLYGDQLYKEAAADEEIVRMVCGRYGLDYDTFLAKDVTKEMYNYEEALWLAKDMGDCPLLAEDVEDENEAVGISSLEIYICEVYAFGDGKAVIESMCKEFGINPHGTVISDLTAEQLIQIGEKAYETSDHPKG